MSNPVYVVTADASGKLGCAADLRDALTAAGILPLKLELSYDAATRKVSAIIKDTSGVAISNSASTVALPAPVDANSVAKSVTVANGEINLLNAAGTPISTTAINVGLCSGA